MSDRTPLPSAPPNASCTVLLERACTAHSAKRLSEAEQLYREYLAIKPDDAKALHNLGVVGLQMGQVEAAISLIRRSLEIDEASADAQCNLGLALKQVGHLEAAEQAYRSAIAIDPMIVDAHSNLGVLLKDMHRADEARVAFRAAVALSPDNGCVLSNFGLLEVQEERPVEALEYFEAAAKSEPDNAQILANLGGLLADQGRYLDAIDCLEKAYFLEHFEAHIPFNLGRCYFAIGQLERAIASYQAALDLDAEFASAHHNLGHALLAAGRLEEGWREYKWRWRSPHYHDGRMLPHARVWCGEKLDGRHLLIWSEQGVGDKLLFASLIPEVLESGAKVTLETEPRLVRLFQRSFPGINVITDFSDGAVYDYQIPLGDLPSLFRVSQTSFGPAPPYLMPDADSVDELRSKYRHGTEMLVGLSWASRPPKGIDLNTLAPLFRMPGVRVVNLQYGTRSSEIRSFERAVAGIPTPAFLTDGDIDPLADVDSFVAQVAAMDAVVTIQNTTLYAAGGVGAPTFAILPPVPDWRWLGRCWESPWHDNVRLYPRSGFRGAVQNDSPVNTQLDHIIADICNNLRALKASETVG